MAFRVRARRLLPGLIGLSVLAGCTSLAPEYKRPPAPIPAQFPVDSTHPEEYAEGPAAAELAWADYFTEPGLQDLIARALANNRDLRTALLRIEEARAAYGISRAERAPTIGLGADAARSRSAADFSPAGQATVSSQYQLGVGVNHWELDFWGRIRSLNDAALETYLATTEAWRAASLLLILQVADGYLNLRALDERIDLAEQALATRTESRRVFARRYEVGSASRLDLTQADLLQQQAQALVQQLQLERSAQMHALGVWVGEPGLQLPPVGQPLSAMAPWRELAPGLPSELLQNRPDMIAAEHMLKASNARIGAARALFFPRIALTGLSGTASAELDGLFGGGTRVWSFAPSISLPLFDGGERRAQLELTEVRRDLAVTHYENTIQNAFRDVADALAARQWQQARLATLQATEITQAERARLANRRYEAGAARYFEVLDAERDLLATQQQLVLAHQALLIARLRLYNALGGGSTGLDPAAPAAPSAQRQTHSTPRTL